ncbi:MAG: MerR family transcriptional regulator [Rhodobacteraceae bacterium]|nr:MerR family transcriptional regulator [Paracoccaceae bacterium]|tara:strand:+ start:109 stop:528 length:420 start_codon:yes stop_codon:yes gene_type:complete
MQTEEYITIRQICDEFEVTPRTIRFYEAKELLFPIRQGQKRLFDKRDRARMKLILRGKRYGFSLEEIRQLLDLYRSGGSQKPQVLKTYTIALERLEELEKSRENLTLVIEELREQIKWGENLLNSLAVPKRTLETEPLP